MKKTKTYKVPRSIARAFPQVKHVVLARRPVMVEVSAKDCADGKKLQTEECALAVATKRQFHADGVAIRLSDSYVIKGNKAIRFATPVSVAREIVSFDRHQDFAPGRYRLSAARPAWAHPGKHHQGGDNKNHGSSDRTQKVHKSSKPNHRTVRVRTVTD